MWCVIGLQSRITFLHSTTAHRIFVTRKIAVIGAGVGGLTAAALLAKRGFDVTVLEAHIEPGGCAATFFHQGYRFDVGATLVGGFHPGGPHQIVGEQLGITWPIRSVEPALAVHLPDRTITRWSDADRWREERVRVFGSQAEKFWSMQERVADAVWDFSARVPTWPVASLNDALHLLSTMRPDLIPIAPLALTNVHRWASALGARDRNLMAFLDGQLLIAAQGVARDTNGLYGAAALDLYRRGVAQVKGGVGNLAATLANAVEAQGGQVLYRHEVTSLRQGEACPRTYVVETKRGSFEADVVLVNLTPWAVAKLMGNEAPARLQKRVKNLQPISGAFTAYLGVDEAALENEIEHQQVIVDPAQPLGEGNSIFVSISPKWDQVRVPHGQRAVTISTHTRVADWYALADDEPAFEERKQMYLEKLIDVATIAVPTLKQHIRLTMPGTPLTFERFTHRVRGMVGGFPQKSLWAGWAPRIDRAVWLVGDSVFPGQSTAGVTLGALRVAREIEQTVPLRQRRAAIGSEWTIGKAI
jgi:C-3',4' desaturase CrtD